MLAVILNCFTGVMASTLPAMFPTHIRYSALAAAFNICIDCRSDASAGGTAQWKLAGSDDSGVLFDGHRGDERYRYFHERDGQSSVKGATPAASDIEEAKGGRALR